MLIRDLQISVEDYVGMIARPMAIEIHQQKCQIVKHIDTGESVVEFDGIKENRPVREYYDVVQMKIAVTSPDMSIPLTFVQDRRQFSKQPERFPFVPVDRCRTEWPVRRSEDRGVFRNDFADPRGAAKFRCDLGRVMKFSDGLRELRRHLTREAACVGHLFQEIFLIEPAHHDDPIHCRLVFSICPKLKRAMFISNDREDVEIKIGRRATVDRQFPQTHLMS